jgi:hypothetical protein
VLYCVLGSFRTETEMVSPPCVVVFYRAWTRVWVLSTFLLVGCTSAADIQKQQAAADDAKCLSDGTQKGDQAYTACRARLENARLAAASAHMPSPIQNRPLFHPGQ